MFDLQSAIDLTVPIRADMLLYPGDSPPRLRRLSSLDNGDALTASELIIGCHVGTHVDAPAHFLRGGLTVDRLSREHFFGPAIVLDLTSRARIDIEDIHVATIPKNHHILLKTANSVLLHNNNFQKSYTYVAPDCIKLLVQNEPLSIGIDYYSLDPPFKTEYPAHRLVAEKGLPAFVCLDLGNVTEGQYFFSAFALPVLEAEGLPVRAFLWPKTS